LYDLQKSLPSVEEIARCDECEQKNLCQVFLQKCGPTFRNIISEYNYAFGTSCGIRFLNYIETSYLIENPFSLLSKPAFQHLVDQKQTRIKGVGKTYLTAFENMTKFMDQITFKAFENYLLSQSNAK